MIVWIEVVRTQIMRQNVVTKRSVNTISFYADYFLMTHRLVRDQEWLIWSSCLLEVRSLVPCRLVLDYVVLFMIPKVNTPSCIVDTIIILISSKQNTQFFCQSNEKGIVYETMAVYHSN